MEIFKEFTFESAHFLPNAPEGHKCRRLHGHSFRIAIFVSGQANSQSGWVIDYGNISKAFSPVQAILDHCLLNEVEGLENPTSEHICVWVWNRLKDTLSGMSKIVLHETCTTGCVYEGR